MAALRLPCAVFRFPAWRLYRHLAKPSLAERLPHGMRRIHRPLGGVSVVCTNEWLSAVAVDAAAHRCVESVRRHSGFKPWTLSAFERWSFSSSDGERLLEGPSELELGSTLVTIIHAVIIAQCTDVYVRTHACVCLCTCIYYVHAVNTVKWQIWNSFLVIK